MQAGVIYGSNYCLQSQLVLMIPAVVADERPGGITLCYVCPGGVAVAYIAFAPVARRLSNRLFSNEK
jgi:hypothetical protein